MKKLVAAMCVAALLTGCGQPANITVNGVTKEYPTYGLLNMDTSKSDKVCYEISVGNVVWSIIGIENIFMPVYFIGFSLFDPVTAKSADGKCGIDS
jgi:hypothetical protein